jgi:hypothetical protein
LHAGHETALHGLHALCFVMRAQAQSQGRKTETPHFAAFYVGLWVTDFPG